MVNSDNEQTMPSLAESSDSNSPVAPSVANEVRTDVNAASGDPTDGRKINDWRSRYNTEAISLIRQEMGYLLIVFVLSNVLIFSTWYGCLYSFLKLNPGQILTLKKHLFYSSAGMLGGVTFGIKYFYRVVARGYWHYDRRVWRFMSPLIAMTVAFIVGVLIDASYISSKGPATGSAFVSIGFLAGYFADEAVGKMYDIANVLFGRPQNIKASDGK